MHPVLRAIVPGWKGRPLPATLPRRVVVGLHLSFAVADLLALVRHGRTFRMLPLRRREELLQKMATHRLPWLRRLVYWWKCVALVTRC